MARFPNEFTFDLGSLDSTPVERSDILITGLYENDIYQFTTSGTRNINLSLNNIGANGDADLELYRDSNDNGVLDLDDEILRGSYNGSNFDDSINSRASAGTYFARVNLFSAGNSNSLSYDLDLSATELRSPSNGLATQEDFGDLSGDVRRRDRVSNRDTSDVYEFELDFGESVDIRLRRLSNDADIRVIQDVNENNIVDDGEVIASSTLGSNDSELISGIEGPGDYFVQVYQYTGATNYQIVLDYSSAPIVID